MGRLIDVDNIEYYLEEDGSAVAFKEDIEQIPSAQPDLDSAYTEGYTQAEAKYRKMWDEMPSAQPEPQWIPVEERLPEKYKYVLTTYTIQPWRSKKPKRFVHIAEWMGDGWQSPIDEYLVRDEVAKIRYLAWMPLPEPWRGEETCTKNAK